MLLVSRPSRNGLAGPRKEPSTRPTPPAISGGGSADARAEAQDPAAGCEIGAIDPPGPPAAAGEAAFGH